VTIRPWREDVIFGSVQEGETLKIGISSRSAWKGKLIFDTPRHKTVMKMPLDWPRINQFPEWFTVKAGRDYVVHDIATSSRKVYTAQQLSAGINIQLPVNTTKYLLLE